MLIHVQWKTTVQKFQEHFKMLLKLKHKNDFRFKRVFWAEGLSIFFCNKLLKYQKSTNFIENGRKITYSNFHNTGLRSIK